MSLFTFLLLSFFFAINSINKDELNYYYKDYIKSFGYDFEEHKVTTEDGYILNLWHLVPKNPPVPIDKVAFIQHGFTCTPWVFFQLKEKSLPFLLSQSRYDIWLGNSRGTLFALDHVSKDHTDANGDYWDYSLDDLAAIDLPTSIDYVKQRTKKEKVYYLGHSQGTAIFFMLYRHNPAYIESSVEKFVALGTVPSVSYTDFFGLKALDGVYKIIEKATPITKAIQFNNLERVMLSNVCKKTPYICRKLIDAMANTHATNRIDYKTIYPFMYYYPGGTNSNSLLHWSQIHQQKDLVYFNPDYYKTKVSVFYPIEPIKKWKVKAFIQRSDSDTFSSYDDVTNLYNTIEDKSKIILADTIDYGHLDELAAESSIQDIYYPIINFLNDF